MLFNKDNYTGAYNRVKEGMNVLKKLTDKPTGKRPLGKPRRRWEGHIRIDRTEMGVSTRNN